MTAVEPPEPTVRLRAEAEQTLEALAGRLRVLQQRSPLSLRALAKRTHVSASTLSRCFNAHSMPSLQLVETLANLLDGDAGELRGLWHCAETARDRLREAPEAITALPRGQHSGPGGLPAVPITDELSAAGPSDSDGPRRGSRMRMALTGAAVMSAVLVTAVITRDITLRSTYPPPTPLSINALPGSPLASDTPQSPAMALPTSSASAGGVLSPPAFSAPPGGSMPVQPPALKPADVKPAPGLPDRAPSPSPGPSPSPKSPSDPKTEPPSGAKCEFTKSSWTDRVEHGSFIIEPGGTLKIGGVCQVGAAKLVMQPDGDLVVTTANEKWSASSKQPGVIHRGRRAEFLTDQKLAVYDAGVSGGQMLWASDSEAWRSPSQQGPCCGHLAVQSDGNIVIYNSDWIAVWSTDTRLE